jgi:hypothetical protein
MTMSSPPVRCVSRNVILGLGLATFALAMLTIALPAELLQRFLFALCNRLRNNAESVAGLGLGLALLTVFNIAFWRHLRRAYASPRRRWRGDR